MLWATWRPTNNWWRLTQKWAKSATSFQLRCALLTCSCERLHPNASRKIKRSLEVFRTSGIKHSDMIKWEFFWCISSIIFLVYGVLWRNAGGLRGHQNELNYNCCVLWLDCPKVNFFFEFHWKTKIVFALIPLFCLFAIERTRWTLGSTLELTACLAAE